MPGVKSWAIVSGEGLAISAIDALIAAAAMAHDLTLVTRNARDFAPSLVGVVNPWRMGTEHG
jgi:predicted nucleic acid-binding protein